MENKTEKTIDELKKEILIREAQERKKIILEETAKIEKSDYNFKIHNEILNKLDKFIAEMREREHAKGIDFMDDIFNHDKFINEAIFHHLERMERALLKNDLMENPEKAFEKIFDMILKNN